MASIEKLLKAFEAIKSLQVEKSKEEASDHGSKDKTRHRNHSELQQSIVALASGLSQQGQQLLSRKEHTLTSKDKIILCTSLTHQVLSGLKSGPEVQKVLALGMESLLLLIDDPDPDVRSNADESLNKMIRGMTESYNGKILLELFKEIKKNGTTRSLRGALSRFALMCHHIRPQKCRAYIQNLIYPLTKIAKRNEDPLQETLAQTLEKILPVLGHFTNDNEIRTLMRAFLPSISNESPSIRRSAASSLILLCRHSRKPNFFFLWLLDNVLQAMIPVQEDTPRSQVLGGLLLIRSLVPQFPQLASQNKELALSLTKSVWPRPVDMVMSQDQTLQVYELCLHYCCSKDHNIVTTSLEALQALLQNMSTTFSLCLTCDQGVGRSCIVDDKPRPFSRAPSQVSVVPILADDEPALEPGGLDIPEEVFGKLDVEESKQMTETEDIVDEAVGVSINIDNLPVKGKETNYSSIQIGSFTDNSILLSRADIKLEKDLETPKQEEVCSEHDSTDEDVEKENQSTMGNIGSYLDDDIPLKYLIRFLCSSFLLSGKPDVLLSDQEVKVSRKALALSCISYALCLQPSFIKEKLFITEEPSDSDDDCIQRVEDILLYQHHADPQLRATTATVIGHFIAASSITNNGCFNLFSRIKLSLECLLDSLCRLLSCKSSVTVRGALVALKCCLPEILRSSQAGFLLPVIPHLFKVTSNSYWLVKVDLCDLLAEVSVKLISHMETNEALLRQQITNTSVSSRFSYRIVHQIFAVLATDHDSRVRTACAKAVIRLVPELMLSGDIILKSTDRFIRPIFVDQVNDWSYEELQNGLEKDIPFHRRTTEADMTACLSKTIHVFSNKLFLDADKYSRLGCLEVLSMLCNVYPPSRFHESWLLHITNKESGSYGLPALVLSLSSESYLSGNLTAQQFCLNIVCNCLTGLATKQLLCGVQKPFSDQQRWSCFGEFDCTSIADRLMKHIMKILNIYVHILEDVTPGSKPIFPLVGASSSISPIKMKSKSVEDKSQGSITKGPKSDDDKDKLLRGGLEGSFSHLPEYIKIYDTVKNAHNNYMMSLDSTSKLRLCGLLEMSLNCLGSMLQLSTSKDVSGMVAELLTYLKTLSSLLPAESIQCGRQLLRCLFVSKESCETKSKKVDMDMSGSMMTSLTLQETSLDFRSLYSSVFLSPMVQLKRDIQDIMEGKMDLDRRLSLELDARSFNTTRSKPSDKLTLSYIRLFEPLVIKALKHYTISSDVCLQKSVLDLLINLVEIPVNYCLLDSEQIFIGYVIKQFEYIEEGQMLHADLLIPSMFSFLVLLSYERHHSKSIIGVPKIIQLCDGLMASDQPPLTHCILALEPLVKDLFIERGKNALVDQNELETQKEVLSSMLVRLAQYHQALHLLSVVLVSTHKSNKDRWRKLSLQIVEVLIPAISKLEININSEKAFYAVDELLNNVCPSVFRPPDILLKAMLTAPNEIETTEGVERWIGGVLIIFRVLVSRTPVDLVLVRLQQLGLSVDCIRSEPSSLSSSIYQSLSPKRTLNISSDTSGFRDPLNVSLPISPPQMVLARFILEVVRVGVLELRTIQLSRVHTSILGDTALQSDPEFLAYLTQELLMILCYLVENSHWEHVTQSLKDLCVTDSDLIEEIGEALTDTSSSHPFLTLLWCKLITDLDYASQTLWSKILGSSQRKSVSTPCSEPSFIGESYIPNCLPLEFVRKCGLLILSEFVVRHMQEGEWLTWLVVQHINDVVRLCKEQPIINLLKEIYASSAASALLIQAVHARIENIHMVMHGREIVSLVSGVHVKQSGPLIVFLVEKLLPSPLLLVSRLAASLCSQRLYLLLATASDSPHFLPQDIKKIISVVRENSIHKRYIQICGLLQQLIDPDEDKYSVVPMSKDVTNLPALTSLDGDWFMQLVRNRCSMADSGGHECSQLLSNLEYNDILSIMSSKHFNKRLLSSALRHGLVLTLQAKSSESLDRSEDSTGLNESALYAVSKIVLFQHLEKLISGLPKQHMIYSPGGGNKYSERLSKLFANEFFTNLSLETTASAVLEYMSSTVVSKTEDSILMFGVVGIEYLHWQAWLGKLSISTAHVMTECMNSILLNNILFKNLNSPEKTSVICSLTNCIHIVVSYLYEPKQLPHLPHKLNISLAGTVSPGGIAAQKLMQLVLWLEQNGYQQFPKSISKAVRSIVMALGRTALLNGIARVPPEMWNLGWDPEITSELSVPPLPTTLFQETDVLKQFIFRMSFLGFLGRHQFEETWMIFLSVLNSTPTEETPAQEIPYINQSLSLAVRGTTALLVQTLLMPNPGDPHSSTLLKIPRDQTPSYLTSKGGQKLQNVMQLLHRRLNEVKHIIKESEDDQKYNVGQVSVEYLAAAVMSTHPVDDSPQHFVSITGCYEFEIREKQLNSCGLDVQSCLHFLHYLYSSWLQTDMCSSVVAEVVKSVSILCDLFTSAAHHRWVLETLVPLHSVHPMEDYITGQYIILATSKALATLKLAQQEVRSSLVDGVFHIIESGLRHSQVSIRTCSLQGVLYLLQAKLDENSTLIHMATGYVLKYTEGKNNECENHAYFVWDLCIFLVEHYTKLPDPQLPSTILHMALTTAVSASTSRRILKKTLKGVERLVLVQHLPQNTVEVVLKLVMDLILNSPESVSLEALPLFFTLLYISTTNDESTPVDMMETDPELLLQLMEKVSILFDKIRNGYPYEAEILSGILGTCLLDILPASQILNKVITEYISSHQPHPHLLAATLFHVFEGAVKEGGNAIVQEWVLLSLSNFTQRVPVSLAVWCLTCFFIAASSDTWLRAAFPSVQARLGKLESRDIQIFCLAATHFRQSLASSEQREKFDKAFQAVAISGSPFEKLLNCIETLENNE